MKKKVLIGLIIIVLVILLFPRRNALNDGGTIEYKAVVYKVSKVHRYKIDGKYNNNYENGIIIEVFGKEIYNNVKWTQKNIWVLKLFNNYCTLSNNQFSDLLVIFAISIINSVDTVVFPDSYALITEWVVFNFDASFSWV